MHPTTRAPYRPLARLRLSPRPRMPGHGCTAPPLRRHQVVYPSAYFTLSALRRQLGCEAREASSRHIESLLHHHPLSPKFRFERLPFPEYPQGTASLTPPHRIAAAHSTQHAARPCVRPHAARWRSDRAELASADPTLLSVGAAARRRFSEDDGASLSSSLPAPRAALLEFDSCACPSVSGSQGRLSSPESLGACVADEEEIEGVVSLRSMPP
jgi:hypothetical protein